MDAELQTWWLDFGTLAAELRRIDRPDVSDLLIGAVRAGACGSEILCRLTFGPKTMRHLDICRVGAFYFVGLSGGMSLGI